MIYTFAYTYADQHRDELSAFTTGDEINRYLDTQNAMADFVAYAQEKGVNKDVKGLKESGELINTQLKAYIARNIIGEEGFYPIIKNIDKTLLRAIDVSRQDLLVQNIVATDSVVNVLR